MRADSRAGETPETASDVDPDGIDRTLIREFLALTPVERLDLAEAYAHEIEELRALVRSPGIRE